MRSIAVSTDVFAKVWSLREQGEDTEDAILRRVLGCDTSLSTSPSASPAPSEGTLGFYDARHRVAFPEGFEVFRTYLGTDYRAHATGNAWVLQGTGKTFRSLNALSRGVGARTENAWVNWFYTDAQGQRRPVSDLRDPDTIAARADDRDTHDAVEPIENHERAKDGTPGSDGTWRDDVRAALEGLGGHASLRRIYKEVERIRRAAARSVPPTLEATIRRTLEDHSSDSENHHSGRPDLFWMPEGKGAGVWALR